jgi:hypothetical protein
MIHILTLLVLLAMVSGCANHLESAWDAARKGNHTDAAKHYLHLAAKAEGDNSFGAIDDMVGEYYCAAAIGFQKAGGAENTLWAEEAARKGINLLSNIVNLKLKEPITLYNNERFRCKLLLAEIESSRGQIESARAMAHDYLNLGPRLASSMSDDVSMYGYDMDKVETITNLIEHIVQFLRTHEPQLAGAVEAHYASSKSLFAWQLKAEREAQVAREVAAKREREALAAREAVAKREREAQAAREAAAKAEYERQHPEIAAARQAQAAAEQQCTNCKSSCDTQALTCATACFGNLKDTMCSVRCQATLEACKGGCEQRRDAQIAQAGGTPIGSSSSSGFMQGLVAVGDSMAAAKGISPAGTVGRPSSSQTGLAGLTQALSAMAGGNVVPPGASSSSAFTAPGGGSVAAGGSSIATVGGQCDDSAEAREVDAMTKRATVETKGMGIERLQCYTAQQYVRIAELQVRAATRCNVHMAESQAELQNMQAQSRKLCQGVR